MMIRVLLLPKKRRKEIGVRYRVAAAASLFFPLLWLGGCVEATLPEPEIALEADNAIYDHNTGQWQRGPADGVFQPTGFSLFNYHTDYCQGKNWDFAFRSPGGFPQPYCEGPNVRLYGEIRNLTLDQIESLSVSSIQYRRNSSGDMIRCTEKEEPTGADREKKCKLITEDIPKDTLEVVSTPSGSEVVRFRRLLYIPVCPIRQNGLDVTVRYDGGEIYGVALCEPFQMARFELKQIGNPRPVNARATVVTPLGGDIVFQDDSPLRTNAAAWIKSGVFLLPPFQPLHLKDSEGNYVQALQEKLTFSVQTQDVGFIGRLGTALGIGLPGTRLQSTEVEVSNAKNGPLLVTLDPNNANQVDVNLDAFNLEADFKSTGNLPAKGTVRIREIHLDSPFKLFTSSRPLSFPKIFAVLPSATTQPNASFSGTQVYCGGGICERFFSHGLGDLGCPQSDAQLWTIPVSGVFCGLDLLASLLVNELNLLRGAVESGIPRAMRQYRAIQVAPLEYEWHYTNALGGAMESAIGQLLGSALGSKPSDPYQIGLFKWDWLDISDSGMDAGVRLRSTPRPNIHHDRIYYAGADEDFARPAWGDRTPQGAEYQAALKLDIGLLNQVTHALKKTNQLSDSIQLLGPTASQGRLCGTFAPTVAPVLTTPAQESGICKATLGNLTPGSVEFCLHLANFIFEVFETNAASCKDQQGNPPARVKDILRAAVDVITKATLSADPSTGGLKASLREATLPFISRYFADPNTTESALSDYSRTLFSTIYRVVERKISQLKLPAIAEGLVPARVVEVTQEEDRLTVFIEIQAAPTPELQVPEHILVGPEDEISFPVTVAAGPEQTFLGITTPAGVEYQFDQARFQHTGTATFRWTPGDEQVGVHPVQFTACKTGGRCEKETVSIAVCNNAMEKTFCGRGPQAIEDLCIQLNPNDSQHCIAELFAICREVGTEDRLLCTNTAPHFYQVPDSRNFLTGRAIEPIRIHLGERLEFSVKAVDFNDDPLWIALVSPSHPSLRSALLDHRNGSASFSWIASALGTFQAILRVQESNRTFQEQLYEDYPLTIQVVQ